MKNMLQNKVLIVLLFLVARSGYAIEPPTVAMTMGVLDITAPITLTTTADAYVKGGVNASTNYGSESVLEVKQGSIDNFYRKTYVKFDLSSIAASENAVVRLYTNSSGSAPITVYEVPNTWSESVVTWNSSPTLGTAITTTTIGATNQYYEWDVSAYVESKVGASISFAFYDASASNTTITFSSKEGANSPQLVVYPTSEPDEPSSLSASTVSASAIDLSWTDNADNETGYKVERKSGAGAFTEIASLSANSTSYSDTGLSSLTYYTYRVAAYNAVGSSYSSAVNETTLGTPVTYTYEVSEDTYIKGGINADTNYGSSSNLEVKQGSAANYFRKSFLKFDLSAQGLTTINQATLRIYANSVNATTITAFELSDDWSEHSVTWNSAPSNGSSITSEAVSVENVYYEFDVTDYVQAQVSGDEVVSVSLWDAGATNKLVYFNSNEAASNRPELVIETLTTAAHPSGITGYFVDAINGNDANDGLTEATAWKTFTNVNATTFAANDTILLKAGNTWLEPLHPKGSGTSGNPIVITSYGVGPLPIIDAQGSLLPGFPLSASIRLYNQEYWEITNVHVKNYAAHEETPLLKNAIAITGDDYGTLHDINIRNVEVSDVNGDLGTRTNGGIAFLVKRDSETHVPTNYDGVTVENCYIHDVSNCGVFTDSKWSIRDEFTSFGETTLDSSINDWYPSYNIVVRNNRFERTGGNGMVIRVADGPLVEYNTFYKCGLYTTGNASYPFNCDNALWQYNEASHTVYNPGDADASGFDSDYYCKNTIIQYNYSHDNEYGSLLITSRGASARNFNVGTIVRYNVFENDGHHMIRVSGTPSKSYIYNNVFYVGEDLDGMEVLWHKNWGGYSDSTFYTNNIFHIEASDTFYEFELSTNNFFDHNIFYGDHDSTEPSDANKITSNPLFVNPGTGGFGFGTLDGYKLQSSSPAIDAGANIAGNGGFDFWGNALSDSHTDIGAFEYSGGGARTRADLVEVDVTSTQKFSIYPNPINGGLLTIDLTGYEEVNHIEVMITSITGQAVYKTAVQDQRIIELDTYHLVKNSTYIVHVKSGQQVNYSKLLVR
ncbi:DNRLRE domain-containing protein [Reichenbachiella carrageenanivorans]|uniref:DNRLRE domain-containing protein n=1 Tax=Reichenbachiella carrageenanivorans TaxID=2979869 RepID=A0ABY6CZR0_9BACT|nr:DNRLRE domain-containing protein [Reichenbachiella carrageenanivorans]UXX79406.1 DNRLRE domain-containing protein [Reichenbachiella carrageenanivorans]